MRSLAKLLLAVCSVLLLAPRADAQDKQPSEYAVKAAFLFNFIKFVEWPAAALPEHDSVIVVGVFSENPFLKDLDQTIQNKKIGDHPVLIKQLKTPAESLDCQVIFLGETDRQREEQVLGIVKAKSILTVGELDKFIESGGMINFVREGTKIRFQINQKAATDARLQISAKLLMLAVK
jgi:hypothetical protein